MARSDPTFTVVGLNQMIRDMRRAGNDVNKFKHVHGDIGEMVAARAKQLAPKKTGKLAGSIKSRPTQRLTKIHYGGARIPYAGLIHWGSPKRGIKGSRFVTRAAKETEPQWTNLYLQEIEKILGNIKGA